MLDQFTPEPFACRGGCGQLVAVCDACPAEGEPSGVCPCAALICARCSMAPAPARVEQPRLFEFPQGIFGQQTL